MTVEVKPVGGGKDPLKGQLGGIGKAVGTVFGGPIGAMIGGAAGGLLGGGSLEGVIGGMSGDGAMAMMGGGGGEQAAPKAVAGGALTPSSDMNTSAQSSPVSRWQQNQQNMGTMQGGLSAIQNNPELMKRYGPVLNDAMSRARGGYA